MPEPALQCKAILFDLDGVLIDSSSCIERHWRNWAARHRLDLQEILSAAHGMRTVETMRRVAPHLDVEREAQEFLARETVDTEGVQIIPGAARLLAALPEKAWALVTSAGRALAAARLRACGLPVPRVMVSAEDVRSGKPSPEPYLLGAERMGLASVDCLVIEDSPAGITAAKGAGMRVIAVTSTHSREELLTGGADIIAGSLNNLQVDLFPREGVLEIRVKSAPV